MKIIYTKKGKTKAGRNKFIFTCENCHHVLNPQPFYDHSNKFNQWNEEEAQTYCNAINKGQWSTITDNNHLQKQIINTACYCDGHNKQSLKIISNKPKTPEEELAGMRAKKMLDPTIDLAPYIEKVKNNQHPKTLKFWNLLESYGAYVQELYFEGYDTYSFKITVAGETILDVAEKSEILDFVKNAYNGRTIRQLENSLAGVFLKEILLEIKGNKVITLCLVNEENGVEYEEQIKYDINEDGQIGYSLNHRFEFLFNINMAKVATIIVRQFLSTTFKKLINNKQIDVPYKNLYGFLINKEGISIVPKKILQESFETDAETGKPLPPEDGITYSEFIKNEETIMIENNNKIIH